MSLNKPPLRIVFRTDASIEIGIGHLMRCLTLADVLRKMGADCVFLCRAHAGNLLPFIVRKGHRALALPTRQTTTLVPASPAHADWLGASWETDAQDTWDVLERAFGGVSADWLVVDHYGLDARWETAVRPACSLLAVIDDLADRPHDCDLLLDQSLGREVEDYGGLVPAAATLLLGPRFAPMRPEFAAARNKSLARRANPKLESVLVTLGGVDKDNVTTLVLDALDASTLPVAAKITVVMGETAPWIDTVRDRAARMLCNTEVRVGVHDMASLMVESDLAIGAGGTTNWERCALGLPGLILTTAKNQKNVVRYLHRSGAAIRVGDFRRPDTKENIVGHINGISADPSKLLSMSRAAARICDGSGADQVAEILQSLNETIDTRQNLGAT